MILVLLLAIGVGLIVEAFAPGEATGLLPELSPVLLLVAVASGLVIGPISRLPTVTVGVARHARRDSYQQRSSWAISPMSSTRGARSDRASRRGC